MATVTKEQLRNIVEQIKTKATSASDCKKIVFSFLNCNDIVPVDLVPAMQKIVGLCYSNKGKGYNGIIKEIIERTTLYCDNDNFVRVKEFRLHTLGQKDMIDKVEKISHEIKSGAGNWLYSRNSSFATTINNYKRRKEWILWDYDFSIETKKNGVEVFNIHIDCPWRVLFDFLSDYPQGFSTWWKENGRSGENGLYIWEMQTIKTSRKKALYLTTFEQWKKDKGITY